MSTGTSISISIATNIADKKGPIRIAANKITAS
jgi:hypothetical protein